MFSLFFTFFKRNKQKWKIRGIDFLKFSGKMTKNFTPQKCVIQTHQTFLFPKRIGNISLLFRESRQFNFLQIIPRFCQKHHKTLTLQKVNSQNIPFRKKSKKILGKFPLNYRQISPNKKPKNHPRILFFQKEKNF